MTWSDRLLIALFRRLPATESIFTAPASRPRDEYERDSAFHAYFHKTPREMYEYLDVLDLGSGYGGTTVRIRENGARSVVGLDVEAQKVTGGESLAKSLGAKDVTFVRGVGESMPIGDERFDLVVMHDVLEHVHDARAVLAECQRVLRPGGRLATVFPPYYQLIGGSHLHGYATRMPGLNLVFTTRQLRSATRKHLDEQGIDWRPYLRESETDKLWNLNGLTVRGFRRIVSGQGWNVEQMRYLGKMSDRPRSAAGRVLWAVADIGARTPIVREALCSRVCAMLVKTARCNP